MSFIKLRKANQSGEETGSVVLNSDQIVGVSPAQPVTVGGATIDNATQISTADGKTHWVMETVEQVLEKIGKN